MRKPASDAISAASRRDRQPSGTTARCGISSVRDEPGGRPPRIVVLFCPGERHARQHERSTHAEIARRLAALKGFGFAGAYDPERRYGAPLYFVPCDALPAATAHELGIAGEGDLFGGIVPRPFVATKAISHSLVSAEARAPAGWCYEFGCRVHGAVLRGFTAFALEDARCAGHRLLEHGPVRIKPVRETGGHGQSVVADAGSLDRVLRDSAAALLGDGLVLEGDLTEVTTYSVGHLRLADFPLTYYGLQRLTRNNAGAAVYGGSDLTVVRGGFEEMLAFDMPEAARLAVSQARSYDAAAMACFPGLCATRRNYDVLQGRDAAGRPCSGVLEQSWRIGGASAAEILALERLLAEPALGSVQAACFEVYGAAACPPADATIFYRGSDGKTGPLVKFARIGPHGDAR